MDTRMLTLVRQSCQKRHIDIRAILLHGSWAVCFANENSDYDVLILTDERGDETMDVFITPDHKKVQIEFMTIMELKDALEQYEDLLFQQLLDLNIMAGRVLTAQIITGDQECEGIICSHRRYKRKDMLMKRYVHAATNFYSDARTSDWLLRKHSLQMAAIHIGTAILIKNDVFWLHIKWQHRFLEQLLLKEDYLRYLSIRWPQDISEQDFVEIAKMLIEKYVYIA